MNTSGVDGGRFDVRTEGAVSDWFSCCPISAGADSMEPSAMAFNVQSGNDPIASPAALPSGNRNSAPSCLAMKPMINPLGKSSKPTFSLDPIRAEAINVQEGTL
jgi:hypothetical protein